jgi:hypothetical protein
MGKPDEALNKVELLDVGFIGVSGSGSGRL